MPENSADLASKTARREKYDFSEPFFEERLAIFVPAGKAFVYDDIANLSGKTFAVLMDWSYGDEFNGAVIAVGESGAAAIGTLRLEGKVVALPRLLVANKIYLAFAKATRQTSLLAEFNKAMASMQKDGSFKSIINASFAAR
jgi:ABC-type amino acid transport substrate-binding protein